MPVIAGLLAVALVALVAFFMKTTGDPEPTAKNLPDYTRMKPEEIMAAHEQGMKAQADAQNGAPKR